MMMESYVRQGRLSLRKWAVNARVRLTVKIAAHFLRGLLLSAAGLGGVAQPMGMGLVCVLRGWPAAVTALGSGAGYLLFWGRAGLQGLLWLLLALMALPLTRRCVPEESPLLTSAVAALLVSASGLIFQIWMADQTSVALYLLRIALGAGAARIFALNQQQEAAARWAVQGIYVLALARISLFPGFSLGYPAAGLLAAWGALPAAALAGLALDLSRLTPTPMTAVLCLAYLTRLVPIGSRWLRYAAPGAVYLAVMGLCGQQDLMPMAGLALGGIIASALPPQPEIHTRRGETGLAQVRLELMSGVLIRTQQLLLEDSQPPIDEGALLTKTRERACGGCPCRKTCREREAPLPGNLLHRPLLDTASLTVPCKKPGRLILELRRSQEQLRAIKADREKQAEYRAALVQQYQFLGNFLQQLADQLPRRHEKIHRQFEIAVDTASAGRENANGDRLLKFPGVGCKYYVLLCDGMGTGLGAAQDGQNAAGLLRQMLGAGFPAEYALRSVNSLLSLRGRAGAVTMDLAEIDLDSGRAAVFKWGAAPSYLIRDGAVEKIGTAGPPPGLSVRSDRETTHRLSLRRGEMLVLTSDGVDGEGALRRCSFGSEQPPGELAAKILEYGGREMEDDATVAVIRLTPDALST